MKKEVIQFNESHKWCATFGYIHRTKGKDLYMIAVSSPGQGAAFIIAKRNEFDIVGATNLILGDEE